MTSPRLATAVLLSAGRHPISGAPRPCRGDAVALEIGRRLAGDGLRALHAGVADEPALLDYLALGAGSIEVLSLSPGHDVLAPLAGRLCDMDLILTGTRAEQGAGSGLLPYALARALGRPIVANVLEAWIASGEVEIRQFLPKGRRRRIAVPLPAVLTVHPLAAAELRYAYARRLQGRIEVTQPALSPEQKRDIVPSVGPAAQRPAKLKAEEKKAGHARLMSAIVSEARGGIVAFDGSPVDKAQVILTYLREHRLVEF